MKILNNLIELKTFILSAQKNDMFYYCFQKYVVMNPFNSVSNVSNISINTLVEHKYIQEVETKLAVCGILQIGNRYLAVKRKGKETFGLIGGKVDFDEDFSTALLREAKEETGFDLVINHSKPFFLQEDHEYLTACYLLQFKPNGIHTQLKEGEEPYLYLLTRDQLINDSPFKEYNTLAFAWYNL